MQIMQWIQIPSKDVSDKTKLRQTTACQLTKRCALICWTKDNRDIWDICLVIASRIFCSFFRLCVFGPYLEVGSPSVLTWSFLLFIYSMSFFFCFSPYLYLLYFFFVLLFFSFDDTLPLTYGNSTHQCQIKIIEIEYLLTMILQNLNKNLMRKRQSWSTLVINKEGTRHL